MKRAMVHARFREMVLMPSVKRFRTSVGYLLTDGRYSLSIDRLRNQSRIHEGSSFKPLYESFPGKEREWYDVSIAVFTGKNKLI